MVERLEFYIGNQSMEIHSECNSIIFVILQFLATLFEKLFYEICDLRAVGVYYFQLQ